MAENAVTNSRAKLASPFFINHFAVMEPAVNLSMKIEIYHKFKPILTTKNAYFPLL
jgi:hypothetical protein